MVLIVVRLRHVPPHITRLLSSMAAVVLAITVGLAPLLWTCSSPSILMSRAASQPCHHLLSNSAAPPPSADPRLIVYLQQHEARAAFLVATVDTDVAVPHHLHRAPVMALGGYTGYDPIFTPATLAKAVARNEVRSFYLPSSNLTPQQRQQFYPNVTHAGP